MMECSKSEIITRTLMAMRTSRRFGGNYKIILYTANGLIVCDDVTLDASVPNDRMREAFSAKLPNPQDNTDPIKTFVCCSNVQIVLPIKTIETEFLILALDSIQGITYDRVSV